MSESPIAFNFDGGIAIDAPTSPKVKVDDRTILTTQLPPIDGAIHPKVRGEFLPFLREYWFTLGHGDGQQPYYKRTKEIETNIHWGQLKLMITELQFLTLYWDPKLIANPILVYVGAASGHHIVTLAKLFPTFEFILYDVRKFDSRLMNNPQITIKSKFFDDTDAETLKLKGDRIFFICDIRSSTYTNSNDVDDDDEESMDYISNVNNGNSKTFTGTEEHKANEKIVWENMQQQSKWVKIIQPVRAHLKMRLPYVFDFSLEEGEERKYLDGVIYRQPWSGSSSTEMRLVPNTSYTDTTWNIRSYETACFYHNKQVREEYLFNNPLTGGKERIAPELGLENDYDSICTALILKEYLEKFGIGVIQDDEVNITNAVKSLFMYIVDNIGNPITPKRNLLRERENVRAGNRQRS